MISPNTILDERFQIIEKLGEGGMGRVWIGIDRQNRAASLAKVIIKELKSEFIENDYALKAFFNEAAALNRIDHKGVVKFLAIGQQANARPYLAIEFIEGVTLRSQIEQGGISDLTRVANIIKQLGAAISAAHDCGIHHRDLKPENIMLKIEDEEGGESVKVIDFGIATIKSKHDSETQTTMLLGTVDYMAPEQIRCQPSFSTDIYAIGAIAYEMVTGAKPFNVRSLHSPGNVIKLYELQSQSSNSIVRPQALRPDLPLKADALIIAALAFDPKDRPARADLFGDQLAAALLAEDEFIGEKLPRHQTGATSKDLNLLSLSSRIPALVSIAIALALLGIGLSRYWPIGDMSKASSANEKNLSAVAGKPLNIAAKPLLLSYSIGLSAAVGKSSHKPFMEMVGQDLIFHDNDYFKFNLRSEENIFLYILNESPEKLADQPKYTLLYPGKDENNLLKKGQIMMLPGESDPGLKFTGRKGLEKIWLIMSKEKIAQLEELAKFFNSKDLGVISDSQQIESIKALLAQPLLSMPEVDKEKQQVNIRSAGDITITLIKLQHN